ncbi:DUF6600 domain-containing protein [Dokdonella sp.]|uniref:DUF6600 domain-containing protein n=1 Tax=Dokdonella sp. TaxID=2291710 RepID=UPI003AF8E98D
MSNMNLRNFRLWCAAALILIFCGWGSLALADPPDRVARISYLRGNVSFQPAGSDRWVEVSLNRPLVTGDQVYTDRDSRVEFELGGATIRLDERSNFNFLNLDSAFAQIELTGGVMNLDVRSLGQGQSYEIDTPTLAFVVRQPGNYRIDIAPAGDSTMVTVFEGSGDVYGENNASYAVRAGNSYRFYDAALRDYEILDIPRNDPFDRWCMERNSRYQNSISSRYVPESMIGYADLDRYGSWSSTPDYGAVWYPTRVAVGWAPYRSGHWSWIDPWGWTWIDTAPWGFAPFHYGRWVYAGSRWGWYPGPRVSVAIYSPAMVAFVGGSGWGSGISVGIGGPVGWFPLGPRDVYVPWYRTSRNYFVNININNTTYINHTHITNVYNDYSRGRPLTGVNYAYLRSPAAVTAVSRDVFVNSRPVLQSRVRVSANELRNTRVVNQLNVAPVRASIAPISANTRVAPPAALANRTVLARTAPPPRPVPVDTRLRAIERNNAQPLQRSQMEELAAARKPVAGAPTRERVQVVGRDAPARAEPLPMRAPAPGSARTATGEVRGSAPTRATPEAGGATRRASPGEAVTPSRSAPERSNVPSRAAPPGTMAPTRSAPERSSVPSRTAPPGSTAPSRSVPQPATPPSRAPRETDEGKRSAPTRSVPTREALPSGALPSSRYAPRNENLRSSPAERGGASQERAPAVRSTPTRAPENRGTPPRDAGSRPPAPATPRSAPQYTPQREQRSAPQVAPQRHEQRSAPQVAPQRYESRPPATQRQAPRPAPQVAPQRHEPRSAPQVAPPTYQRPQPAPQRSAPQPSAPQRSAPQPQRVQPTAAPPARAQPPALRERPHPKQRDDDDHRH